MTKIASSEVSTSVFYEPTRNSNDKLPSLLRSLSFTKTVLLSRRLFNCKDLRRQGTQARLTVVAISNTQRSIKQAKGTNNASGVPWLLLKLYSLSKTAGKEVKTQSPVSQSVSTPPTVTKTTPQQEAGSNKSGLSFLTSKSTSTIWRICRPLIQRVFSRRIKAQSHKLAWKTSPWPWTSWIRTMWMRTRTT